MNFGIFSNNFSQKIKQNCKQYFSLSLKIKSTTLILTVFTYFSKIDETLGKNSGNLNKNNANRSNIHQTLNYDNAV